jgi:hypothetical protein
MRRGTLAPIWISQPRKHSTAAQAEQLDVGIADTFVSLFGLSHMLKLFPALNISESEVFLHCRHAHADLLPPLFSWR